MDETVSCFSLRGTKARSLCSYGMLVVVYHFRDSLSVPSLHMGPKGCLETSVNMYQLASRNVSEERSPQLHGDGNLKSRTDFFVRHTHQQKFSSATLVGGGDLWLLSCRKPLYDGPRDQKLMCAPGLHKFSRNVGVTSAFHTLCSEYPQLRVLGTTGDLVSGICTPSWCTQS